MGRLEVLQEGTKGLSYINVGDMDLGQRLARKLVQIFPGRQACVIIKHEMPSGVALGDEAVDTFEKAWKCDPLSNFGGVDVFSYRVTEPLARLLVESPRNVEVVYAPDFAPEALEVLATRKVLRVVKMGASLDAPSVDNGLEVKRVAGGLLVQKRFDSKIVSPDSVDVVSKRKPGPEEVRAALFNWTVACFTRSNAVVIGTSDKTHGIGSGQRSRIDSAEDAIRLSRRGYGPEGTRPRLRRVHALPRRRRAGREARHHGPHLSPGLDQGPGGHRQGRRARPGHDHHPQAGRGRFRALFPAPLRFRGVRRDER